MTSQWPRAFVLENVNCTAQTAAVFSLALQPTFQNEFSLKVNLISIGRRYILYNKDFFNEILNELQLAPEDIEDLEIINEKFKL